MLGASVDPRLFVQDYSGIVDAAKIRAQGINDLGSGAIQGVLDYKKAQEDRKKLDAGIKASVTGIESAIKMGDSLGIDTKSSLQPFLDKINDPNTTPADAAAYAQQASNSISNVLNFGIKANDISGE